MTLDDGVVLCRACAGAAYYRVSKPKRAPERASGPATAMLGDHASGGKGD